MKLIILAAGYATRLPPLHLDQPKPLILVANKPMIEHVLDNIITISEIDHAHVVTNEKFARHFQEWAKTYSPPQLKFGITVVNDGSTDDASKLGAIGDTYLVLREFQISDDIIVVGGDNLFSHDLAAFAEFCRRKNAPVLAGYDVVDLEEIKKFNSIEVDEDGRITFFEEKPALPKSTLTGLDPYYYPRSTLPLIHQYMQESNNPHQPGGMDQCMYNTTPFFTASVPACRYDA